MRADLANDLVDAIITFEKQASNASTIISTTVSTLVSTMAKKPYIGFFTDPRPQVDEIGLPDEQRYWLLSNHFASCLNESGSHRYDELWYFGSADQIQECGHDFRPSDAQTRPEP